MRNEVHFEVPYRRYLEGIATGLAYAGALAALGVFLVGSFRPYALPAPYWARIAWLRTDTFGFACFLMSVVAFSVSEFFRLSRRVRRGSPAVTRAAGTFRLITLASARALAVAGSVLVVYLSVNAVTHPQTLLLPATHLLPWPTEGTLRIVALIGTACAAAVARAQQITMSERSSGVTSTGWSQSSPKAAGRSDEP